MLWLQLHAAKHKRKLWYKNSWKDTFAIQENIRQVPSKRLAFPGFVSDFMSVHYAMHPILLRSTLHATTHGQIFHRYQRWYCANAQLGSFITSPRDDRIPRVVHDAKLGSDALRRTGVPFVITRAIETWPAMSTSNVSMSLNHLTRFLPLFVAEWSGEQLAARFPDVEWNISHTVTDGSTTMTMAAYMRYMQQQRDAEPLYIFDSECEQPTAVSSPTTHSTPLSAASARKCHRCCATTTPRPSVGPSLAPTSDGHLTHPHNLRNI